MSGGESYEQEGEDEGYDGNVLSFGYDGNALSFGCHVERAEGDTLQCRGFRECERNGRGTVDQSSIFLLEARMKLMRQRAHR